MTLYAIFDPKPGKPALPTAVPERFSWLATLLPPVFLAVHGLWLELVAFLLTLALLAVLAAFVGGEVAFLLYTLGVAWLGLAAPGLRRHALQWRGWRYRDDRIAVSADMARLEAMQ